MLATANTVDFIYTCPGHLSDYNFATKIADETASTKPAVSAEEIAKVKQEWEEKQKKKKEKEKANKKEGDEKDKKDEVEGSKSTEASTSPTLPGSLGASGSSTPSKVTHEKYALHRDFFAS